MDDLLWGVCESGATGFGCFRRDKFLWRSIAQPQLKLLAVGFLVFHISWKSDKQDQHGR